MIELYLFCMAVMMFIIAKSDYTNNSFENLKVKIVAILLSPIALAYMLFVYIFYNDLWNQRKVNE